MVSHEEKPRSDGRQFDGVLGGDPWDPSQSRGVRSPVPWRLSSTSSPRTTRRLATAISTRVVRHRRRPGARGSAAGPPEEGRATGIRDPRLPADHARRRPGDPLERERAYKTQGFASPYDLRHCCTPWRRVLQELATHVSLHRNTGRYTEDPVRGAAARANRAG